MKIFTRDKTIAIMPIEGWEAKIPDPVTETFMVRLRIIGVAVTSKGLISPIIAAPGGFRVLDQGDLYSIYGPGE